MVSATRAKVVEDLQMHLEYRSRQFEDFSALLEQNCIDGGEDGLGADGPHTTNLNIAHEMHDEGERALNQTIKYLETELPDEAVIAKIQEAIVKVNAKGEDE